MSVRMNWVDRLVNHFNPHAGNRRIAARFRQHQAVEMLDRYERLSRYNGGFESAENSRDAASWLTSRLSPDSAMEEARETQLERADSAYKNTELGTSHVEGRANRVSGLGTSIDPAIDPDDDEFGSFTEEQAEAWNDKLRRAWSRQAARIGKGNKPLWRVQRLMTKHLERHGEWFLHIGDQFDAWSPTTLKVEVIHPKLVETPPDKAGDPTVRMGVQLNEHGEAIGYYVRTTHPGDTLRNEDKHRCIPANYANGLPRLIHYFDDTEAGEHRGYPRMQVGFKRLKNSDEYEEAETERNFIGACLTAFVRTDLEMVDATAGTVVDADGKRVKSFAPGMIQYVGESDQIDIATPQGAPASFDSFMHRQTTMFAAGANTSYPFLTNDFRGLNYNTLKVVWNTEEGACDIAHQAQADAIIWVYSHFVNRAILVAGLIEVDVAAYKSQPWLYSSVRVIPPARRSIDPAREDNAEIRLIENEIKPASDLVERKNGQPAPQVYKRIARDKQQREGLGLSPIEKIPTGQTMPGDLNDESSDANKERQEVGE